ncbi:MAG TPA: MFS transporter [Bryobacteraceae bacterium]|nr:MFS transporter [Bryobacteraceae bacterium]
MNRKSSAIPVFFAFLAMGFGDAVGPFVSLARETFHLSNFTAQLIPFVGFLMFGLLSVPMGVWQDSKGKKFILMLGLSVMLIGLVIPAIMGLSTFPAFLVTMLLLGAGATTLQVAGNPIMRDVSAEGKYARNLSLGQFVKAIGSLSGPLIPVLAARWLGMSWQVIFPVYSVALLVTLLLAATIKVDDRKTAGQRPATFGASLGLLGNGYVAMMVIALFFYVGAEVSVSSGIPLYLKERFQVDINRIGLLGTGLFFAALTVGRFSGGLILNWIKPATFFIVTCAVSLAGLLGLFVPSAPVAVASFFVIGLGFANVFPLIFAMVIEHMPDHANALSGLMVTAIVGGAIVPPLMGLVADSLQSVQASFLVPLAALVYIGWCSLANLKQPVAVREN